MTWHDASHLAPSRLRQWWRRFVRAHIAAPEPVRASRIRLTHGGVIPPAFTACVSSCQDCGGFSLRVRASDTCYFCGGRRWDAAPAEHKGAA